jgi:Zn-dependent protease with chaperone function
VSRTTLLVAVVLAVYALVSFATGALVVLAARGLKDRRRSRPAAAWFWLRLSPAVAGTAVAVGTVLPAFALYEPAHRGEQPGPALLVLAGLAVVVLASAAVRLGRLVWTGWLFNRQWLDPAPVTGIEGTDLPVHVIDRAGSLVALVGMLRPRLVVSSDVMAICSRAELAAIAAHETAHLRARDNLKRLLLDVCPDVLRWSRLHDQLTRAWSAAAEEEADDEAADPADTRARVAMAALLVKLARLAPERACELRLSSPLIQPDDLGQRVKRLCEPGARRRTVFSRRAACLVLVILAVAAVLAVLDLLPRAHRAAEFLVQLGQ